LALGDRHAVRNSQCGREWGCECARAECREAPSRWASGLGPDTHGPDSRADSLGPAAFALETATAAARRNLRRLRDRPPLSRPRRPAASACRPDLRVRGRMLHGNLRGSLGDRGATRDPAREALASLVLRRSRIVGTHASRVRNRRPHRTPSATGQHSLEQQQSWSSPPHLCCSPETCARSNDE
jgi:hypothetical protein